MSAPAETLETKGSFSMCYLCSRSDLLPIFPVEQWVVDREDGLGVITALLRTVLAVGFFYALLINGLSPVLAEFKARR